MTAELPADRLIVGNCVEVMRGFPEESIDLTVTSPPYDQLRDYKGYEFDAQGIASAVGSGGSTKDKVAFQHPAIFPEKLAEEHILSWSQEGDIVLDPMCGSGTTCKMAMLNNRHFIGIDISPDYIAIAKQRLEASAKEAGSQLSLVA